MGIDLDFEDVRGKTDQESDNKFYNIPHIIKYMGSKKPILDFVIKSINEIHEQGKIVCDLFAGSCSVSAALRHKYDFISNDVQIYSKIIGTTYFSNYSIYDVEEIIEQLELSATIHQTWFKEKFGKLLVDFESIKSLDDFAKIENNQRLLIHEVFETDFYLFTKIYSGTYWSLEQCVWIDSIRKGAESFINTPVYYAILSSLMYAMSYTTQSTGHFAQYRDGSTEESMLNILTYRKKSVLELFKRKMRDLMKNLHNSLKQFTATTLSYEECLKQLPIKSTVYADPPYAPVHYSRFYHALETLIRYDYPDVEFKGRYRKDRHQSPFSQKTNATDAFETLFKGIVKKESQMVLSYSNSGVLGIETIYSLAENCFSKKKYDIEYRNLDHEHSTMGRSEDSKRKVEEHLIIAKFK